MIPNLNSYSKGRNLFILITLKLVLEDMNLTEVIGTGKIMLGTTKICIIWNLLRKTNYINIDGQFGRLSVSLDWLSTHSHGTLDDIF